MHRARSRRPRCSPQQVVGVLGQQQPLPPSPSLFPSVPTCWPARLIQAGKRQDFFWAERRGGRRRRSGGAPGRWLTPGAPRPSEAQPSSRCRHRHHRARRRGRDPLAPAPVRLFSQGPAGVEWHIFYLARGLEHLLRRGTVCVGAMLLKMRGTSARSGTSGARSAAVTSVKGSGERARFSCPLSRRPRASEAT